MKLISLFALLLPCLAPAAVISTARIDLGGFVTSTYALAEFVGNPADPDPASIFASADVLASTNGPVRPGFLEISGTGDAETSAYSLIRFGDFSFGCGGPGCFPDLGAGLLRPFTLGTPFQIHVEASANRFMDGAAILDLQFALFESTVLLPGGRLSPGARVQVFDPPPGPDVPEPATCATLLLGGLALLARRHFTTLH